jgi:predicted RNA-binding Zn ribbon-like protein
MEKVDNSIDNENRADALHKPIEGRVHYRFGVVPAAGALKVLNPPVWTGGKGSADYFDEHGRKYVMVRKEHLRSCYFSPMLHAMKETEVCVTRIPADLYRTEFLDLDPFNIQELLYFQRKYGFVHGARAHRHLLTTPEQDDLRPEPDGACFAGEWAKSFKYQLAGIRASAEIFDTVPKEGIVESIVMDRLGAVSFMESIATVVDAQNMIKDSLRVLRDDMPPVTVLEAAKARRAAEWLSAQLPKSTPAIELVYEGTEGEEPTYSLMDAIRLQLARGLAANGSYRTCQNPECEKLFSPNEVERRADTKYCSAECQERAKRLRYIARRAKK